MVSSAPRVVALALVLCVALRAGEAPPPKSWIDPDSGHRVLRLTDEPGSDSFYFNVNAYTPDGKLMAFTTPEGISVLDLNTFTTRLVVPRVLRAIVVGAKTSTVYFTREGSDSEHTTLWSADIATGRTRKLADLPRRATVATINADETLGAGGYIEGNATAGGAYDGTPAQAPGRMGAHNLGEPEHKEELMELRLNAKLPMTLFTIDLRTGQVRNLIEHSTDWLNHFQFSPTDPSLLMYCHEGVWQHVDRIWTIRTDGTHNALVHRRTMTMEIAGHEWWGPDGKTLWYQLSLPRTVPNAAYLAGYNCETGARIWYHFDRDARSIHHNASPDGKLFCGDGDTGNPWIVLCRPHVVPDDRTLGQNLISGGYLEVERLVNLAKQNYRLEPNPSFTPDQKWIVFRANIFGPDYAFAVEVAKSGSSLAPRP